jgi:hypothetical protein
MVGATVTWEDSDRPVREFISKQRRSLQGVYPVIRMPSLLPVYCSPAKTKKDLDGRNMPELLEGLTNVMSYIRHWYYSPDRELVKIEGRIQSGRGSYPSERAGFFLSGGIDSLAALRRNRLNFPQEHDSSFKDALCVYGLNIESDINPVTFAHAINALTEVTKDAGATLIPVYTNIRILIPTPTSFCMNRSVPCLLPWLILFQIA